MKWQVNLIGNRNDLEELTSIFNSSDLKIIRKGDDYLLESSLFTQCKDDNSVKDVIEKLLNAINAIRIIKFHLSDPITRGAIYCDDLNGIPTIILEETVTVVAKIQVQVTAFNAEEIGRASCRERV